MRKLFLSLFAAACLTNMNLSAQITEIAEEGIFSISIGETTMTVDAGHGGKILSFKYGETEILSQSRFPNSFGSTFWTSPQAEWNWPPVPEYDRNPYTAEIKDGSLVLTGQKSERFGYRIRKEFHPDRNDKSIAITYTIINESGETRKVAPWEISRVENGGLVFFDAKETVPANNMKGIPFLFTEHAAWFFADEEKGNRKINANGKGWLAFCDKGLMLLKKFEDINEGEAAPGEAEIQIYVNSGKTFMEIEEQGAYTSLEAGEELDWTVRWYLVPQETPSQPCRKLLKKVKKIIK